MNNINTNGKVVMTVQNALLLRHLEAMVREENERTRIALSYRFDGVEKALMSILEGVWPETFEEMDLPRQNHNRKRKVETTDKKDLS